MATAVQGELYLGMPFGRDAALPAVCCHAGTQSGSLRCTELVVLQVAVFAPGVYEVSDYTIVWTTTATGSAQGTIPGPRFLLRVEGTS